MKRLICLVAALALVPTAAGSHASTTLPGPNGLSAFQLQVGEAMPAGHTYPVMPAFAWKPVPGAKYYDFQLADNPSFSGASVLWADSKLTTPVASVQYQVPWMTGAPYALWVHVRATVNGKVTGWSKALGFNTGWQNVPAEESAPTGLIRWTPVEGATAYQVWFTNINRVIVTLTNTADEREFWTLHPSLAKTIQWRVRAVRGTKSTALPNGNAITPYGPWSQVYTTQTSGTVDPGPLRGGVTIADTTKAPFSLMPAFSWKGTNGIGAQGAGDSLWRVYVFSDKRCVNPVMVGSITGESAWSPRATQPLALPSDSLTLQSDEQSGTILKYGSEGNTFMADLTPVTASEASGGSATQIAGSGTSTSSSSSSSSSTSGSSAPATSSGNGTTAFSVTAGAVELPDSGYPTGRYWWTVVPVKIVDVPPATPTSGGSTSGGSTSGGSTSGGSTSGGSTSGGSTSSGLGSTSGGSSSTPQSDPIEYHDAELPQDACAAGRVWSFSLRSAPVTASNGAKPYASGVTPGPRLLAASQPNPTFVKFPLVTWKPALGAQAYEIQLSRNSYPWRPILDTTSVVTSVVLPLSAKNRGTWYYRVRGINPDLPAHAQKMTWSTPVKVNIVGDVVSVAG